jgi:DNA mismatch endonuclease (patch repair protein)
MALLMVASHTKIREQRKTPESRSGIRLLSGNAKKRSVSYAGFKPSSPAATNMGRGNPSAGTAPEMLLQAAMRRAGLRFRANARSLPGCPNMVLRDFRVAVFCDGDFWHGRRWGELRKRIASGANVRYWVPKIERNIQRDRAASRSLRRLGWRVVRVWESAVLADPGRVASRILAIAKKGR